MEDDKPLAKEGKATQCRDLAHPAGGNSAKDGSYYFGSSVGICDLFFGLHYLVSGRPPSPYSYLFSPRRHLLFLLVFSRFGASPM